MNAYRRKPEIGKPPNWITPSKPDDDSWGCIVMPLVIVISYFVLMAIARVTSNSGSKLDQVICYGTLICFIIIMLLGFRDMYRESKAKKAERWRWAQGCKTASLTIVDRRDAVSWWDDYNGRYQRLRNSLELEMNADQKGGTSQCTTVTVEVNQFVYDRLKERNTVRIYYQPEAPLTFLLEEEL